MTKIITFFNNKGGVGKTTSSILLADYFEKLDKKILLLDLDPQGNLSKAFFSYNQLKDAKTFYDFSENNEPLENTILNYSNKIDVIPASFYMQTIASRDSMYWKKKKEEIKEFSKKYDIVIIDAPPAINAFSWLALLLCHFAFIPLMLDAFSRDGLKLVLEHFEGLKPLNPGYQGSYAFISCASRRRIIFQDDIREYFRAALDNSLLKNEVPEFIGLKERQITKESIFKNENADQRKRLNNFCEELKGIIYG